MQVNATTTWTVKLAGSLLLGLVTSVTPARASDDTFEPEIRDPDTPLDFPYNPPPNPDGYDQPTDDYGGPQVTDVGYDNTGYTDGYDDGYDPNAYQSFETALSPYGTWIDDPFYGRVWMPAVAIVGANFSPYFTGGHFMLTEYGWTWVSDYAWGWAPFHYGRWIIVSGFGWCWVPGTVWGPAWVTWRSGGGYVGWAPLPPRGVTISVSFGSTSGSPSAWRFVPSADLGSQRPRVVAPHLVHALFKRTSVISNHRVLGRGQWTTHINAGPQRSGGAAPVRLAEIAPTSLPRQAIVPRPGSAVFPGGPRPGLQRVATPAAPHMLPHTGTQPFARPSAPARHGTAIGSAPPSGGAPVPFSPRVHGAAPQPPARPVAPPHMFRGGAAPTAPRTFTTPPGAQHLGNPGGGAAQFRGGGHPGGVRPGPR
jgi:hypothetical protein